MKRQTIPWDWETVPISKSGVQQYGKCPYRFMEQFIYNKVGTTEAMEKGKRIHNMLEELYQKMDKRYVLYSRSPDILFEEMAGNLEHTEETERFMKIEMDRFRDFLERKKLKFYFPRHTEIYLEDRKLMYYGTPDRVDKMENGCYIVIDYKTGKFHKWLMSDYRFEMMGYKHLLEVNEVARPVSRWAMLFLGEEDEGKRIIGEEFHSSTISAFYNRVKRVKAGIKSHDFHKKETKLCDWCPDTIRDVCKEEYLKEVE